MKRELRVSAVICLAVVCLAGAGGTFWRGKGVDYARAGAPPMAKAQQEGTAASSDLVRHRPPFCVCSHAPMSSGRRPGRDQGDKTGANGET